MNLNHFLNYFHFYLIYDSHISKLEHIIITNNTAIWCIYAKYKLILSLLDFACLSTFP
jgi:hypothetical protein